MSVNPVSRIISFLVVLALIAGVFMGGFLYGLKERAPAAIANAPPIPAPEPAPVILPILITYYATSHYEFAESLSLEDARAILEMARSSHQFYVDSPEKIKHGFGVEYEIGWVDKYDRLEKLFIELSK